MSTVEESPKLSEAQFYELFRREPTVAIKTLWPDITLYDKQREILHSLRDNDETVVPAGNMLGKDFIAGLGVLWFFLSRHPCRVLTTSVDATQLEAVLWGEIRRFIDDSKIPLRSTEGGPLIVNHLHLRKVVRGKVCGLSYVLGRVAGQEGEGMLGHHIAKTGDGIPRTLAVGDEASGLPTSYKDKFDTWAHRQLYIGNCFPCDNHFKHAVKGKPGTSDKGGDIARVDASGYYRKVIRIKAEDSPNVRYGVAQERKGMTPDDRMLIPGVKSYSEYKKNRLLGDPSWQCVALDADWYEGVENLLYPADWLNRAERIAASLPSNRPGVAIGVDSAMGGDNTSWSVGDELGLIEQLSIKTRDTSKIVPQTLALMNQYGVVAENVLFDAGGGGYQHADVMRDKGYNVRTVAFGESATPDLKRRTVTPLSDRIEQKEVKYIYKNRRAEMYGILRQLLDPMLNERGFGLPLKYFELRRQLAPMPLQYDEEGRLRMLPKNKPNKDYKGQTLIELLGCSPDEADSVALMVFGLQNRKKQFVAGKAF